MDAPNTLLEAVKFFSAYENCKSFMVELRWADGRVKCPRCGLDKVVYLEKARVWKCYGKHDHAKFSLKTGTIFEDSPLGLDKWLPVVWMITNCKNGVSSYEIHRDVKVTQKTAWFMLHRIRYAMQEQPAEKLSGTVEADETFVGGKAANMHLDRRTRLKMQGELKRGSVGKAIVLGLLERHGKARVKVSPFARSYHVRRNVIDNVELGSTIYSDSLKSYVNLPVDGFFHDFVDHSEQYVNGVVHTNGMENFWSLLKRALKGTYVSVEPFHLQAYADEQAFRFNYRKDMDDADRFTLVMRRIVGRRLTYEQLTGKADESAVVH
jgi:transposase-like protein